MTRDEYLETLTKEERLEFLVQEEEYYEDMEALPGIDPDYEEFLCSIGEDPWGGKW